MGKKLKRKWGPRDVAALRRLVVEERTNAGAAALLEVSDVTVGRWLLGAPPRCAEWLSRWLDCRGYYEPRRAK